MLKSMNKSIYIYIIIYINSEIYLKRLPGGPDSIPAAILMMMTMRRIIRMMRTMRMMKMKIRMMMNLRMMKGEDDKG